MPMVDGPLCCTFSRFFTTLRSISPKLVYPTMALSRSAPMRSAPVRLASLRLALLSLALLSLALLRSASHYSRTCGERHGPESHAERYGSDHQSMGTCDWRVAAICSRRSMVRRSV